MKGFRIVLGGCVLAAFNIVLPAEDPPPEHVKTMKDLGAQMGQLRKGVDIEKNAGGMAELMKQVGAFWKTRNSEIAMKTCKESRDGALAVVKAAQESDKAGIAAGMKLIGAGCKGCHDQHREKISETEYKIK